MIELLTEDQQPELNGVAVELFQRGLKDIRPWCPPEFEGLLLPVVDLALVFEAYYNLLEKALVEKAKTPQEKEQERRSIAKLRADMRKRLAPFDGGLVKLSAEGLD
jgi:hypothetical protein